MVLPESSCIPFWPLNGQRFDMLSLFSLHDKLETYMGRVDLEERKKHWRRRNNSIKMRNNDSVSCLPTPMHPTRHRFRGSAYRRTVVCPVQLFDAG